jgi:predicted negative regulator of RcsB-dependent stress response
VEGYVTEEAQVEALKKWWKENGKSVIVGLIIGGSAVAGWRGWASYVDSRGERASASYEQFVSELASAPAETAYKQGERVIVDYGATPYAELARLALAKLDVERGDQDAARGHLRWVMEKAKQPALRHVARLRLARLYLDANDADAAEKLIGEAQTGAFGPLYDELRGDILVAKGQQEEARSAYQKALLGGAPNPVFLQMKLDDLGTGESAGPVS